MHFIKSALVVLFCLTACVKCSDEALDELRRTVVAGKGILQSLQNIRRSNSSILSEPDNSTCQCLNNACSCCAHLNVKEAKLHANACLNITYLPDEYGMEVTLSLNDHVFYRNKVSVKNPPPICLTLHEAAKLCIKFYDLEVKNKLFTGCVDAVVELADREIARIKMGCFRFPALNQPPTLSTKRHHLVTLYQIISGTNGTNETHANRFKTGEESVNAAFQTIFQTIKRLQELNLPKITFNFQPDKILSNLYNSFFNRQLS